MRIALRSLVWKSENRCMATFVDQEGQSVEAEFKHVRGDINVIHYDPDIFIDCDGSAREVRAVMGLATRFMLVAQGEDVDA